MYPRHQASQLKQEFWTSFGQYMSPVKSADAEKINWINYKTGEKYVHFKMQADTKKASISIELSHTDPNIQQLYFEQLIILKKVLQDFLKEPWTWQTHQPDGKGKIVSWIFTELPNVNVFNKEDWPTLISFFKPRMIALDEFWASAKYSFEALR